MHTPTLLQVRDIDNRQFVMFYEAVAADNRRSIGMAVSKDGKTNWQRCPYPILTAAGAGAGEGQAEGRVEAWDEGAVGQPCGVSMSQGKWRLYYAGRSAAPGEWWLRRGEGGGRLGGGGDGGGGRVGGKGGVVYVSGQVAAFLCREEERCSMTHLCATHTPPAPATPPAHYCRPPLHPCCRAV